MHNWVPRIVGKLHSWGVRDLSCPTLLRPHYIFCVALEDTATLVTMLHRGHCCMGSPPATPASGGGILTEYQYGAIVGGWGRNGNGILPNALPSLVLLACAHLMTFNAFW